MYSSKLKKIFSLILFIPLLGTNISCYSIRNSQSKENFNSEENSNVPNLIKGVAALGKLSPSGEVRKLAAPITEFGTFPMITKLLVKEGDFVNKGNVLAVFENINKIKADLDKKNKLLIANEDEISLKEDQIKRYQIALEKEAYSLVSLMEKRDELIKLEKQRINHIGEIEKLKIDLYNSKLRSPLDGYVLSINTRVGERSDNDGILEIGASQNMEALIEVYESDIDRVYIEQEVELTSENGGFQETLFGKVIRISPKVQQRDVLSTDPTGDADARIIEVLVS